MQKCNLCTERVKAGLQPACVRVCSTGALKFESTNKVMGEKEFKFVGNIVNAAHRVNDRK